MWRRYQPNPAGRNVGDCAVRAVSAALGVDWETAFAMIAKAAYQMADMPSSNAVIGAVLRSHGFYKSTIPDYCSDCYTAEDFVSDYPNGIFVLGFGNHVAAAIDGIIYDSWDSRNEIPVYVWYRKRDYPNGI